MKTSIQAVMTFTAALLAMLMNGCTISPPGEARLRTMARMEGHQFNPAKGTSADQPLPLSPNSSQLVAYALVRSPTVQAAYWKLREAIEAIPQAGTEMTTPMLSGDLGLNSGSFSAANSSIGLANMGSSDIRWPSKPAADAKIALEKARKAQWLFREAEFQLQRRVLVAWYQLTATRQLVQNARHRLATYISLAHYQQEQIRVGDGSATGYLNLQSECTGIRIKLIQMRHLAAIQLTNLNLLLNRRPDCRITTPARMPIGNLTMVPVSRLVRLAVERNPNLRALHFTRRAREIAISRAKMEYIPNFDLGAMTSLDGTMQNLTGAIMFPMVRFKAINAAIKQDRYRLFRAAAQRHQARNDVINQLVADALSLRSDAEQLKYIRDSLIPRLRDMRRFSSEIISQSRHGIRASLMATDSILNARDLEWALRLDLAVRQADITAIIALPEYSANAIVHRASASENR